jgi:hypothetical protein
MNVGHTSATGEWRSRSSAQVSLSRFFIAHLSADLFGLLSGQLAGKQTRRPLLHLSHVTASETAETGDLSFA